MSGLLYRDDPELNVVDISGPIIEMIQCQ